MTYLLHRRLEKRILEFKNSYISLSGIFLAALLMAAPGIYGQQPATTKPMRLTKIEVSGLQRYSQDQVIAASGLQVGQVIDVAALDAAAQRLIDTGLFKKLGYQYRATGDQAVVTFQVVEEKGSIPVVFDNFVWFSDEEILSAVRREVPAFDGTAPEAGGVLDSIRAALTRLLQERKIPGQIEYTPSADPSGGGQEHVFSVKGVKLPICTLRFAGAAVVQEDELIKNSKPLLQDEYSRKFVFAFAKTNLIPIYRERGYLRASFREPLAKPESSPNCKEGISVTLPVEEGLKYSWDKAEWTGNKALSVQELETTLKMKSGELANGLKIDGGLKDVREAYGRKGFIAARLAAVPSFDDAGRRVTYQVSVNEGPQYRMGTLTVTGLPESDANRIKARWQLRQGDVYNAAYPDEFMKKVLADGRALGLRMKKADFAVKPDRQKLTVDVTINFKPL